PSQCPDTRRSPEKCAYKPLRIKCFHGVSAGNQHPYLLKSRYGKVRNNRTKGWTVASDSTRRHVNPPLRLMQYQVFFPLRSCLFLPINCKGVIAFACNNYFSKP